MSGHVRDQLSAYLDQELGSAERTAVETHLHGCEVCRRHLETLAAVDAAARALPIEAPAGYFDALPGRVRARLERPAPRVRRVPLRLPAWTWAAAAALVLGVVTPLTMVSLWSSREEPLPAPRPEAFSPPTVAASPLAGAMGEKEEMKPGPADERKLRQAAPASGRNTTPLPARGSIPATGPARDAFAPAPPAAPAEYAVAEAPAPAAPTPSTLGLEARKRAPALGGPYAQQQVQTQEQAVTRPSTGTVASAAPADEPAAAEAEPKALRSEPQAPPAARLQSKSAREKDGAGLREEVARSDEAGGDSPEGGYQRLLVAPAQSLAALRARREAWRAFALRFPESPRADEARVRVVETGAAAWRLGHDPDDRARVREDAAAYLRKTDAAQKARVRAVLEDLGGS
jgi:hypothetical protein